MGHGTGSRDSGRYDVYHQGFSIFMYIDDCFLHLWLEMCGSLLMHFTHNGHRHTHANTPAHTHPFTQSQTHPAGHPSTHIHTDGIPNYASSPHCMCVWTAGSQLFADIKARPFAILRCQGSCGPPCWRRRSPRPFGSTPPCPPPTFRSVVVSGTRAKVRHTHPFSHSHKCLIPFWLFWSTLDTWHPSIASHQAPNSRCVL